MEYCLGSASDLLEGEFTLHALYVTNTQTRFQVYKYSAEAHIGMVIVGIVFECHCHSAIALMMLFPWDVVMATGMALMIDYWFQLSLCMCVESEEIRNSSTTHHYVIVWVISATSV